MSRFRREEMMNRIAEAIKEKLGVECEVQFQNITKNNGLVLKAVIIREPGMAVVPTVYIDEVLNRLMSGNISIQKAAQNIVNIYWKYQDKVDFKNKIVSLSGQSILNGVTYQLINAEKNEDRLSDMPHKRFLDLAAVYRVIVGEDEIGTASFLISNGLCECYGLCEEELDTAARRNTEQLGLQVTSMDSILAEITGELENEIKTGCPVWVLTNAKKLNGAVVMLYSNLFKNLADRIERDLYVLPSSIHEVIVIPDEGVEQGKLKLMVGIVNSREVFEDEFLSGNIYKYIRRENRIVIA